MYVVCGDGIGVAASKAVREKRDGDRMGIVNGVCGGQQTFGGRHRLITCVSDNQRQNQTC